MAIVVAGTPLVTRLYWRWLAHGRPKRLDEDAGSGSITPERITILLGMLILTPIVGFGVLVMSSGDSYFFFGAALTAMFGSIVCFVAPDLTDIHLLRWTSDGVEGTSTTYGPVLGLARTTIPWADIAQAGKTRTGYWFIEGKDGRRIYWTILHKGAGRFVDILNAHCPGIDLPEYPTRRK
jgi:hypothetical protein